MKNGWLVALAASLALTLAPDFSEAKRMGGGKSSGMQRNMPERTSPQQNSPQPTPAAPTQAAGTAATAGAAGAAAAAGKRSWMGPIAGIAAGLGIAALLSHFGLGEGLANMLTILLLAGAAFFLIRFLLRRFGPRPPMPAAAGAGANASLRTGPNDWQAAQRPAQPVTPAPMSEPTANAYAPQPSAQPAVAAAFVPAAFDSEGFARIAKTIFVRLQAAHDNGDLDDLRRFTTPEMFAELKTDLLERGDAKDTTDVIRVDADVLDVAEENGQRIVSVRFRGQVREEAGAAPVDFDEVWHLVQPLADDSRGWQIAGIEQMTH